MSDTAAAEVADVLASGYIGQGPKVEEFERALAKHLGTPNVVTVNSGTSGLQLALYMIGAGVGSGEVLTTPLTCVATNWPILHSGFDIRWADIDPETMNIDLDDVERKMSPRTRAVVVVHWGGYPVDLERLQAIKRSAEAEFGTTVTIVEDCAHAWGSTYRGRPIGTHGNEAVFSFQAIKHLTCGDGGLLVTSSDAVKERAKLLRWYGISREGRESLRCEENVSEHGFKFHMNDINATIGLANLSLAARHVRRHRENAAFYDEALADVTGLRLTAREPGYESSYWLYTMRVENRDAFVRAMTASGIAVSRVHERNDIHSCVRDYTAHLPQLDQVVDEMICIPVGWWVSDDQREHIASTITAGW